MSDQILCISSSIFGLLIIIQLLLNYCNNKDYIFLFVLLLFGIIISLLNHSLTNKEIKYLDRYTMGITFLYLNVLIYINPKLKKHYYLLFIALLLYLIKYIIPNNISHLLCHIIITIYLIIFIDNYKRNL